jgi:hypothetical protein
VMAQVMMTLSDFAAIALSRCAWLAFSVGILGRYSWAVIGQ